MGTVEASEQADVKPGGQVIVTGWALGERHRGGFSRKARVEKADMLVPLPDGLTPLRAEAKGSRAPTWRS